MKKWMLWMIVLQGIASQAQNLTGSWQGTLKPGTRELRIVIKIALDDDKLKATTYSIRSGCTADPRKRHHSERLNYQDDRCRDRRELRGKAER